jgi:hypothetical protein
MNNVLKLKFRKRKKLTSLVGLALAGSRLDGVVLRHTGGALQAQQSFSATLTLDPLTAAPELVGREIRNHLDAAGVRERHCVFGLPVKWALTAHTELPPLPEADAASLLQMEMERGFPSDPATLQLSNSRCPLAENKTHVLIAGIPRTHIAALDLVLTAAKLKPVSFNFGLSALQLPADEKSNGVLALAIGENTVSLQISCGGGVVALRAFEGTVENEAGRRVLHTEAVARETRITLGQLPAGLRDAVKHIRIFGPRELAQPLADEMELRFEPAGLDVEVVAAYSADAFGAQLPAQTPVSAAFSLAARWLMGQSPAFEFLPPKPTVIEQFVAKYSSGRLRTAGAIAAGVLVIVGGLFGFQQIELWRLRSQWSAIAEKVQQLQVVQNQVQQFQPWYDKSYRALAILRQLTLAFPEDGTVTAKTIEIENGNTISCSGNAQDDAALLATLARLRASDGVSGLKVDLIHGKSPMQFTFDFQYGNGGANEN